MSAKLFVPSGAPDQLKDVDPKLLPYTQICDGKSMTPGEPYCCPGEGMVPMTVILDVMPEGLPLSLEWHNRSGEFSDAATRKSPTPNDITFQRAGRSFRAVQM